MEGENMFCFAIGRLLDLLVEEGVHLKAFRGSVEDLQEKLTKMEDLLEYPDVRQDERTTEIIDLADQLIDSIEKYVLQVLSKKSICIRERLLRPKVRLAIDKITTKITDLVNSRSREVDISTWRPPMAHDQVQSSSLSTEDNFVGRVKDINELVSYLVDHDEEQFQVISVYGLGGVGKTALARKVYKDERVLSHFQSFAFVSLGQEFQAEEALKHILKQLVPEKMEEIMSSSMSDQDVIEWLQRIQREKNCLVIIDDIWLARDWETISRGLTNAHTGSKLLLTTRGNNVAERGFCYELNPLTEEESWELFQKKVFPTPDSKSVDPMMEELGRKMVAWCRGIPLAVVVLGGVLVTKRTLYEWERFYANRTWDVEQKQLISEPIMDQLSFSYTELPYSLKPCFLYLANFAEDEEIEAERLYMLWDAQGMILSKDRKGGEKNMDVAKRYLGELARRSLVQAELEEEVKPGVQRRLVSFRLHDLIRDLCLYLVKKTKFLNVQDYRNLGDESVILDSSCLRNDMRTPACQAFYFSRSQTFSIHDKHEVTPQVKSLMFVNGSARKISNLKKLRFLRTLSLDNIYLGKEEFSKELIHVRYLSLHGCRVRKVPLSIGNWRYLQSLSLRGFIPYDPIPDGFLMKLKRLRHLILPVVGFYEVTPKSSRLRLDGLTELETLINLDSRKCEGKDVIKLTNLRRLEGKICISSRREAEELKEFMSKVRLDPSRHSSIAIILDNPHTEIYADVLRGKLTGFEGGVADELEIDGLSGKLLPQFSNFSILTRLTLREFELVEDPMPTLENLSNLQTLALLDGELQRRKMVCSRTGFPQLRELHIGRVENWEKWSVEQGAMPNLFRLRIEYCTKLEMLPQELKSIASLHHLEIRDMPDEFTRRVRGPVDGVVEEGKDYCKIKHVRTVDIYFFSVKSECFTKPDRP